MDHAKQNGSDSKKMGRTWKNWSYLQNSKNSSLLKKMVSVGIIGHTCKMGTHLKKCVIFEKMGHPLKNGSQLEKWDTLGK